MDRYFFILTTIDLFVLGFMCLLTRLSESLNKKQKRGFLLAFALIACISVLEVITIVVDGAPLAEYFVQLSWLWTDTGGAAVSGICAG